MRSASDLGIPGFDVIGYIDGARRTVIRAIQTATGLEVAVKILDRAKEPVLPRRFDRPRRVLAQLSREHCGIVPVIDTGILDDGREFLAIPYYSGGGLDSRLAEGPMTWDDAVDVMIDVAEIVGRAHEAGVTFGDIRPSAILIDSAGAPLVSAFGMATRRFDDGTPTYDSPESSDRQLLGPASDVYSLTAVLAALIAGRPRRRDESLPAFLGTIRPLVPEPLYDVIEHGLAASPTNRHGNAKLMYRAVLSAATEAGHLHSPAPPHGVSAQPLDLNLQLGFDVADRLGLQNSTDDKAKTRPAVAAHATPDIPPGLEDIVFDASPSVTKPSVVAGDVNTADLSPIDHDALDNYDADSELTVDVGEEPTTILPPEGKAPAPTTGEIDRGGPVYLDPGVSDRSFENAETANPVAPTGLFDGPGPADGLIAALAPRRSNPSKDGQSTPPPPVGPLLPPPGKANSTGIPFPNLTVAGGSGSTRTVLSPIWEAVERVWFRGRRTSTSAGAVLGAAGIAAILVLFVAREIRSSGETATEELPSSPETSQATTTTAGQASSTPTDPISPDDDFEATAPAPGTGLDQRRAPDTTAVEEADVTEAPTAPPTEAAPPPEPPPQDVTTTIAAVDATATTEVTTSDPPDVADPAVDSGAGETADSPPTISSLRVTRLEAQGATVTYGSDQCVATRFVLSGDDGDTQSGASRNFDPSQQCSGSWNLDFSGPTMLAPDTSYTLQIWVKAENTNLVSRSSISFRTPAS